MPIRLFIKTSGNQHGHTVKKLLPFLLAALIFISWANSMHSLAQTRMGLKNNFTGEYRLSSQDRIRIRAYEWQVGGYKEWRALSGEFVVDVTGSLFLPLVGHISAKNKTVVQLAKQIAIRLKKHAGLKVLPDVTVEITQYRPVYILGAVRTPGEYPYRPGLTAMRAIAIAGGLFREQSAISGNQRLQRIRAEGRLEQATMRLKRAYLRRARLNVEYRWIKTKAHVLPVLALPREMRKSRQNRLLLDDEVHIMNAALSGLKDKIRHLAELSDLLAKEKQNIERKRKIQKKRVKLAVDSEKRADRLKKKRVLRSDQWIRAKALSLQLRNSELDVNSAFLRILLERKRVAREISDERNRLLEQVARELREVKTSINLLQSQISQESSYLGSLMLAGGSINTNNRWIHKPAIKYTIKRQSKTTNMITTFTASENTRMLPGDIVIIKQELAGERNDGNKTKDRARTQ